jgi:hypothetical protein
MGSVLDIHFSVGSLPPSLLGSNGEETTTISIETGSYNFSLEYAEELRIFIL